MVNQPEGEILALFSARPLSPTQRRIARYIVDHAREAPFLSSGDLANRVGVSQPSVTRFAGALGLAGYPELQHRLRDIILGTAPARGRQRSTFQLAVEAEIRNLQALQLMLEDPAAVTGLGRSLVSSRPLVVLGTRVSAPLASFFCHFAVKLHPDVRRITCAGTGAYDTVSQAAQAGGEWMLAFLLPRHPRESLAVMEYARASGLRVATITDRASAAVEQLSDVVLAAAVGSRLVFDSQSAPMVLTAVLLETMADAAPLAVQERLERFERLAEEYRYFSQD